MIKSCFWILEEGLLRGLCTSATTMQYKRTMATAILIAPEITQHFLFLQLLQPLSQNVEITTTARQTTLDWEISELIG